MKTGYLKIFMILIIAVMISLTFGCDSGRADVQAAGAEDYAQLKNLTPTEAVRLLNDKKENITLIDVRTPPEYESGKIEGAVNINLSSRSFEDSIDKLDKNGKYILYCRSGNRSSHAGAYMISKGFKDVSHISGGTIEWQIENKPLVK